MTPSYRLRECPYCHKHYANVRNHIRMKHQAELAGQSELTAADLLGDVHEPVETQYFCTNCGAIVRRDQDQCSQCGGILEWYRVSN